MPTLGELVAQLERFVGVEVRLEGVHVTILQTCTEKACGADNPCCNRCSEAAYIGVEPQLITLTRADGRPYAVRGTNCKLDGEIGLGAGPYSMLGRLESKADGLTFRAKSLVTEPAPGSP